MVVKTSVSKRTSASRAPRHSKKYWRNGADVTEFEKVSQSGAFPLDKVDAATTNQPLPSSEKKFTRRQKAALEKISASFNNEKLFSLPPPTFPKKKQPKLKQTANHRAPVKAKNESANYDLWEKDFNVKLELEHTDAAEHFLRFTKKKMPNIPNCARFKPTLLNPVPVPSAGLSYNPTAIDYNNLLQSVYEEELDLINNEEKIQNAIKPKIESIVTQDEKHLEDIEGLVIDPRYNEERREISDSLVNEPKEEDEKIACSHLMRKTRKQRLKAEKEKKFRREHLIRKQKEKRLHEVYRTKNINKELTKKEQEIKEKSVARKKANFLKKMTTRQRLGAGDFLDEPEPFLLQDELTENLRSLKPQGHLLADRLTSLRKRNMLPIGSKRKTNKLKSKLKRRFVEKRSVAEVKKGSKVI